MVYIGSKSKIAKYIVPIIQSYIDNESAVNYYEPFCGGCNVVDKIKCENKFASDSNPYLIALLQHLQNGGKLLESVPRELYNEVRENYKQGKYENWFVGNVAFLASYQGGFFNKGFAKTTVGFNRRGKKVVRNYYHEKKANILKQVDNLRDIDFSVSDYKALTPKKNSIIYCDPPMAAAKINTVIPISI